MNTVLADCRIPESYKKQLSLLGFCVISLPKCEKLPEPLCAHTDILTFSCGKTLVINKDYIDENPSLLLELREALPGVDIKYAKEPLGKRYPRDCSLNALTTETELFCKSDSVSRAVIAAAEESGLETVNTNQGYPACTTLYLGKRRAITADSGMASALRSRGIRVCLIRNDGAIKLPPYEYGFIGGCAGVFRGTVYFLGDIDTHADAEKIKAEIEEAGMKYFCLGERGDALLDSGRLVFYEDGICNCG